MRTRLHNGDELVAQTSEVTGIPQETAPMRLGMQTLVERKAAKFLAAQGGTQPKIADIPRRRLG